MKTFLLIPLVLFGLMAGDVVDIGTVTENEGIEIHKCHEGDKALIEVIHLSRRTNYVHGSFETEKAALYLSDLSMIPTGTNLFRVRVLCSDSTSEVAEVRFVIRRPIPRPQFAKAERFPPMPPVPPGMLMPLPNAVTTTTNEPQPEARFQGTTPIRFEPRRRSE